MIPGPGLSLIPEDKATEAAVAAQLHCWARMDNGMTDPLVKHLTCKAGGYFYLPPEVCSRGYGLLPFTSEGRTIECDPNATHQMDRTIWPEDVSPIDPNTCSTEGIQLTSPTDITVGDVTDTSVVLSWGGVPGANEYVIQYRTGVGDWTDSPAVQEPTGTVSGLTPDTGYEFRVIARDSNGTYAESVPSVAVTVQTQPTSAG